MKALIHFKRVVLKVTRLGIFFLIFNKKNMQKYHMQKKTHRKNEFDKVGIYKNLNIYTINNGQLYLMYKKTPKALSQTTHRHAKKKSPR